MLSEDNHLVPGHAWYTEAKHGKGTHGAACQHAALAPAPLEHTDASLKPLWAHTTIVKEQPSQSLPKNRQCNESASHRSLHNNSRRTPSPYSRQSLPTTSLFPLRTPAPQKTSLRCSEVLHLSIAPVFMQLYATCSHLCCPDSHRAANVQPWKEGTSFPLKYQTIKEQNSGQLLPYALDLIIQLLVCKKPRLATCPEIQKVWANFRQGHRQGQREATCSCPISLAQR